MMKNRRILVVRERDISTAWLPSATFLGDRVMLSDTSNQSDLFSSFANFSLFDKNRNGSSAPDNIYGNPYDISGRFNPSMGILIVVLLTAFFSMGFFSMYFRRCAGEEDGGGHARIGGGGGNGRMYRASQGLDKSVIETFPVFNYSLIKRLKQGKHALLECAVCLSEFEDDETLRLLPKCGHAFHPDCIDMWLFSHTTCPLCRSSLLPEQGMRDNVEGQPQQTPFHTAEQGVIVVGTPNEVQDRVDHQDGGRSEMNLFDGGLLRTSPGQALGQARVHNEQRSCATDPPILGIINGAGPLEHESQSFKRSHSTGHSLVRLGGNSGHPSEFYISTDDQYVFDITEGLTESSKFGLHRSSSCASFCQPVSGSLGFFCSKVFANDGERLWRYPSSTESAGLEETSQRLDPHSSRVAAIETDQEFATPKETRFDPRINSDRWHSPIFLRTFSDSRASYFQQQEVNSVSSTFRYSIPQGGKAHL